MTKTTYARRPLSGKKWCPVILNEAAPSVILNEAAPSVILNGAAGGVKDLRYDNVHEMCPQILRLRSE